MGDLFEQVWHGLQGEEPAWDYMTWPFGWPTGCHEHAATKRSSSFDYLATFHGGWRIFSPSQLDHLIPQGQEAQVWSQLVAIWEIDPLQATETNQFTVDSMGMLHQRGIPPNAQATTDLVDLFERAFWLKSCEHLNVWRPSTNPLSRDASKWTQESAWKEFVVILCDSLDVTPENVQPEKRLIKDLGMG